MKRFAAEKMNSIMMYMWSMCMRCCARFSGDFSFTCSAV